jgi:WD40 repeat protein/energy-coupling factor transporter ATP-binding protein EcfA2
MAVGGANPEAVHTRQDLAQALTTLRLVAGRTVRDIAVAVDAPVATVGDYFAGTHLPSPRQLDRFCAVLAACGVDDPSEQQAWVAALIRARRTSDGRTPRGSPPYRGLEPYGEEEAPLFFGRAAALDNLVGHLQRLVAAPDRTSGMVVLVGPSGSGKTSLLMAGLVPAVRAGALEPSGGPVAGDQRGSDLDPAEGLRTPPPGAPAGTDPDWPDGDRTAPTGDGVAADLVTADGTAPASGSWGCVTMAPHDLATLDPATLDDPATPAPAALDPATRDGATSDPATPIPGEPTSHVGRRRCVVVVDQFEEVLRLDAEARAAALRAVDELGRAGNLVVLGLRADAYEAAAAEPSVLQALRDHQVLLGPMTADEVRLAIEGPAARTGTAIEDGLVDLVLADLAPGSPLGFAHGPGALPLLSYALLATWQWGGRNQLTIADYRVAGGIRGAVHQAAEAVYGTLDATEREVARRLFLRLVSHDAAGMVGRRRAGIAELAELEAPNGGTDELGVLERFVAARLLTVDAGSVQISHEALLTAWPRLAEWIGADRDWLRWHSRLADAAQAWVEAGRDESLLLRGARLDATLELLVDGDRRRQLNRTEAELVDASTVHRDQQTRAARRRAQVTRRLLGAVTVLAAASIALAAIAVAADRSATTARNDALSRQVAIEAQQLQATDPSLAAQLAVAAYRIAPTVQARSTLVGATSGEIPTRLVGPKGPTFVSVATTARLLAVARSATDTVAVYRVGAAVPTEVAVVRAGPPTSQDFAVALSPDGTLLAAGGTGRTLDLWRLDPSGRPVHQAVLRGFTSTVYAAAFSPDGHVLAAADADGTVRRWDVTDPTHPVALAVLAAPGGVPLHAVAYSPNGDLLAAAGGNGTLAVWPTGDTSPQVAPAPDTAAIEALAFSPDGSTLVTGGDDLTLRVWHVPSSGPPEPTGPVLTPATSQLFSVAFSPHGRLLAVGSADGSIHLYGTGSGTGSWTPAGGFEAPNPVTGVAFAPHGRLVSADSGGVTRLWLLPDPATYTEPGRVYALAYDTSGAHLFAGSSGPQGDATIWDVEGPLRLAVAGSVVPPASFGPVAGAVASSPDGRLVAVANAQAAVQLFDTADPSAPRPLGPPLHGNEPYVEELDFSPNGRVLAASDDSGQVRMWDVADPMHPRPLPTLTGTTGEVLGFAFSADGRFVATASTDDEVRLYDVAARARPRLLATLGGFSSYAYDTAFTPDGRTLVACSADGTIRLWGIADPRHPQPLGPPLTGPTGDVYAIAVSPDGTMLAAATTSHAVWLWDIADPAHPRLEDTLAAGPAEVFAVAFSPDGRTLVASGSDDTLHLWQVHPSDAERRICSLAGTPITRAEWASYVQAPYRPPCR